MDDEITGGHRQGMRIRSRSHVERTWKNTITLVAEKLWCFSNFHFFFVANTLSLKIIWSAGMGNCEPRIGIYVSAVKFNQMSCPRGNSTKKD